MGVLVTALLCAGALVVPWQGTAFAGHPLGTEDAGTVGRGTVEVEFNYERTHAAMGRRDTSIGNGYTLGLGRKVDLAFSFSYLFHKPDGATDGVRGMGDTDATMKTSLLDGKGWTPSVGIKGGVRLPTGDHILGLGDGRAAGLFTLIADWEIDKVAIHANVGNTINGRPIGGTERHNHLRASLAAEWAAVEGWTLVGEYLWERERHRPGPDDLLLLVGAKKEVRQGIILDAGIRWGLDSLSENVTYLAGLTLQFGGAIPAGNEPGKGPR